MAWTAASTFICQDLFTKSNERKHWVFLYLLMLKSLSWAIAEIYFIFTIPYSKYDTKERMDNGLGSLVWCSRSIVHCHWRTKLFFSLLFPYRGGLSPIAFGDVFPDNTAAIPGWKKWKVCGLTPLYILWCAIRKEFLSVLSALRLAHSSQPIWQLRP